MSALSAFTRCSSVARALALGARGRWCDSTHLDCMLGVAQPGERQTQPSPQGLSGPGRLETVIQPNGKTSVRVRPPSMQLDCSPEAPRYVVLGDRFRPHAAGRRHERSGARLASSSGRTRSRAAMHADSTRTLLLNGLRADQGHFLAAGDHASHAAQGRCRRGVRGADPRDLDDRPGPGGRPAAARRSAATPSGRVLARQHLRARRSTAASTAAPGARSTG